MASLTLAALHARLSPRRALAAAARDVMKARPAVAPKLAKTSAERAGDYRARNPEKCRIAERADYAANPGRHHVKAKRYRAGHPDVEAPRHARFYAAAKERAKAAKEAQERKRDYDRDYRAKRQAAARVTAELCQASP